MEGWLMRKLALLLASVVVTVALVAGCSTSLDVTTVDGLRITTGASGPKPGAPDSGRQVAQSDGSRIDRLAANAVADVETFWQEQFTVQVQGPFSPIKQLISYDSTGSPLRVCGSSTAGLVNAFYCSAGDIVAWDRGELLPMLTDSFGEISVVAVLAHELGHAVQFRLGLPQSAPSIVKEQQADCYTGAYFRWVAEGSSDRFEVSTGPGLNQILSTLFFIRDSAGTSFSADGAHGNAFDRVSAFQFGFEAGSARCAKIDAAEVQSRVTQTGFAADEPDVGLGKGNLRVDDKQALEDLAGSLRIAFPTVPPFSTGRSPCPKPTSPASFCQSASSVTVDLKQLVKIGTPPQRGGKGGIGDFAAFAEVASRHALAAQKAAGQPIEGPAAAQRTACLTGAWASTIVAGKNAPLRLSPGDLDEAIAEMLTPTSLIAADANGLSVPAGFARVDAFRTGFSAGQAACQSTAD
jgi:predicted metalloprotease